MSQIGQEVPILELQAAVYNYDGNLKNWAAKDGGSSRVWIFHNTTTNAYRIIGQSLVDKQYNINSPIKTDLVHKKLRENFIQWRFRQTIFGLSFQSAEDADKFEGMLTKVIDTLGGPTTPQPAGAAGGPSPGGVTQQAASASVHPSGIQTLHRVRSSTVEPQQSSGVPAGSPAAHLASSSGRSAPVLGRTGSAPAFALPPVGAAGGPPTPSPLAHSMPSGGSGILPSPATAPSVASGDPRPPEQRRTQSMYTATPNAVYSTSNPAHLATIRTPGTPAQARPGADVELSNALYAKDNKELSKRDYRAKEIYTSEESYLVGLDVIIEEYLRPSKAKGVFNEKEIRSIFSNIEQIRDLSRELLVAIKAQMTNWTPESTVGEIFLKKMPFMKIYIPYCRDHKGANELLEDKKNNKRMSTYLKESQSNSKLQLDLNALLITPVQRVLRYPLLLKALLEVTEETHPDYPHLVSALEQMQKIADEINQSVEVSESTKAVHELSKTIPGLPRMISTTRQLVKHGPVQVTSVKKSPYTYLLLFSDVAVFASPSQKNSKKLDMKEKIHLEKVWVDGMKDTSSAEVTWQMNSPDATFLIQSAGKEDKTLWVDKCQQRIIATCHKNGVIEDPTKPDVRKFLYKYKEGPKESYEGYWVDAKYEGQGKLVLQDQTVYEGAWEKGKAHGAGKIIYSTGESYDGQWHRDKPHGQGTLITILATYTGGWDNGRKHGTGTLQWANGDVFEGEFVNDLREGNGTLRTADGSEYSGQWKADQYNGRGKLTTKFAGSYDGDWVSGRKHGHGMFTYTNGDQYNGDWVDDLRDGKGTFTQADGKVRYEGDWKEDSWEGNGILIKPDFRYEGEFKGGRMYGNGTLTTPEGTYSGGWAEDRREGKGKWTGANGETYDGEYHSDLRFGKGTWIDVDGSRYDGKWVKGRKEGSGVFTYPNGAKYSGSWQRDRRHGQGVWTTPDETSKYVGDWVNDLREGKGTFTDGTGSYNGEWLRDMRNGQGVLTYGNGISYTGTWKDDRRHGTGLLRIAKQGQPDTVTNMNYENGILIEPPCTNAPPDLVLPRLVIQK